MSGLSNDQDHQTSIKSPIISARRKSPSVSSPTVDLSGWNPPFLAAAWRHSKFGYKCCEVLKAKVATATKKRMMLLTIVRFSMEVSEGLC